MESTSEKIIHTALHLFNSQGLAKVTLRTIAQEMGISQGNLNYHYKKRDDIIEALYHRLVKDMDSSMAKIQQSTIGLQLMYDISSAIMRNSYEYRFFLLDFTQVMRENSKIKKHFKDLTKVRQGQIIGLFNMMIEDGIMRKEKLPQEYYYLYKRIQIFGDFWMASAEIEKDQIAKNIIAEYLEMIMQSIYPYLTTKGIKQYNSINWW
ncbi:TetR family transcriptional regulator [Marivirga sp. S37H4]|uniref:TetR family transcriptional regulator n=1 Tax=Marivirga aurantiaca TaxID=2802615 RepID=A0A934WYZ2_9BACT|nr:TetR/AcrR family transcriptional regulator [Marivirga aurantiaca]MBK6265381.1 TetR family transcriptional regulator [Marivirga aurantiaca]